MRSRPGRQDFAGAALLSRATFDAPASGAIAATVGAIPVARRIG
jgi:hypothetical protein